MSGVTITHDAAAGAWYMQVADNPVARTVQLDAGTLIDLDATGTVVGVEILEARS